jgi:hypothetical protein
LVPINGSECILEARLLVPWVHLGNDCLQRSHIDYRAIAAEGTDAMKHGFELGLYTFGELTPDPQTGKAIPAQQRLADILAAAKLADEAAA